MDDKKHNPLPGFINENLQRKMIDAVKNKPGIRSSTLIKKFQNKFGIMAPKEAYWDLLYDGYLVANGSWNTTTGIEYQSPSKDAVDYWQNYVDNIEPKLF